MAGSSMTFTYDNLGTLRKVIVDWTSDDTTGAVSGTSKKITGTLIKAITDPSATAPTANYDIAITNGESVNVLGGCESDLANRHTANTEEVYFMVVDGAGTPLAQPIQPVVSDVLTFSVTNAGNSKLGQIILFYRHEGTP